jgi:putative ABC transport system permease protein
MTPFALAWSNLTQQRVRTLISLLGVGFAVLLVFMQLGFLDAVVRTATLLYNRLDFDLLLVSREYSNLARPSTFSRRRLAQARAVEGVDRVLPLTSVLGLWRARDADPDAQRFKWSILVLAVDPASLDRTFLRPVGTVFRSAEEMEDYAVKLSRLDTVLMDRTSRPEYGNVKSWEREPLNELNGRQVEYIGDVAIGTGFAYNGLLLTSEASLSHLTGWPQGQVSFGLVQLLPGADRQEAYRRIKEMLQPLDQSDVDVYTREQINDKEERFWLTSTAVGQFFAAGVIIALLVGGVFVYQMMAADISRRLPEYATIRALGYRGGYLSRVVYWQGFLLALIGYVPGLIAALICYELTRYGAGVPIVMTPVRATSVLIMTVVMCMGSASIAVRSVHRANPADLF